jgi:hypothetical protein
MHSRIQLVAVAVEWLVLNHLLYGVALNEVISQMIRHPSFSYVSYHWRNANRWVISHPGPQMVKQVPLEECL